MIETFGETQNANVTSGEDGNHQCSPECEGSWVNLCIFLVSVWLMSLKCCSRSP